MAEGDAASLMEDPRQPGFLEEDRLDVFLDELVAHIRGLRMRDARVARDFVWVIGAHAPQRIDKQAAKFEKSECKGTANPRGMICGAA